MQTRAGRFTLAVLVADLDCVIRSSVVFTLSLSNFDTCTGDDDGGGDYIPLGGDCSAAAAVDDKLNR